MSEGPSATFKVLERDVKPIDIQFKKESTLKEIFASYANKMQTDLYDLEFYFNGQKVDLNSDLTFKSLIGNNNSKEIEINVFKRSKIIKCPKCICNNCVIKVENYKLHFSNCFHHGKNHETITTLLDYDSTQKIDFNQIRCDVSTCPNNQNNYLNEFKKCLKCAQTLKGRARYYCLEHSENHNHKGNSLIKYNEKYFYCTKHLKKFISYCSTHKLNLCENCEQEHKNECGSKIIKFAKSLNLTNIKSQLEEIQEKTEELKNVIVDEIKKMMNRAIEMIEKYKFIAYDIIAKYELNNNNTDLKNYQIIKNIKNLTISNKEIIGDLDGLLNQNLDDERQNWISKCTKLLDIYYGYREHYENKKQDIDDDEEEEEVDSSVEMEEDLESKESKVEDKKKNEVENPKPKNGGQSKKKIIVNQNEKQCHCKKKGK